MPRIPAHLIGTFFGVGHIPIVPATWTSLVVAALFYLFQWDGLALQLTFVVATFVLGVPASTALENEYGEDPKQATIDEACGMGISLVMVPLTLPNVAAAFFLFRVFDVLKPPPARRFESMHGGWGIMLDDVMAGIYTRLAMVAVVWATARLGL